MHEFLILFERCAHVDHRVRHPATGGIERGGDPIFRELVPTTPTVDAAEHVDHGGVHANRRADATELSLVERSEGRLTARCGKPRALVGKAERQRE